MADVILTPDNFKELVLKSKTPVIVDFFANWCGPCNLMAPLFEKLSDKYKGKLKFGKLNTDDFRDFASTFNIKGIPCFIVFSKGKEADRIVGYFEEKEFKQKIDFVMEKIASK